MSKRKGRRENPSSASKLAGDLMAAETDRGCALLAGAILDELLADYLSLRFVDHEIAARLLDEPNAPLATFSARIDLSLALGILDTGMHRAFHIVRQIRNDAAHFERRRGAGFITGFGTPATRDRCLSLVSGHSTLEAEYKTKARGLFCYFVGFAAGWLEGRAEVLRSMEAELRGADNATGATRAEDEAYAAFIEGLRNRKTSK